MARFMTLSDAVGEHLHDGDVAAFEGFTHLIPFAAAHEAIRQGRKDLTLVSMTPDVVYDQMIGMGMAAKLVLSYAGNPGVGLLRRLRDAVEHGRPNRPALEEHSHSAMVNAFEAGAAGLPSAACNVARLMHAPDITLIYESGRIGTAPEVLRDLKARTNRAHEGAERSPEIRQGRLGASEVHR